jgi:hypothetical protein
MRFMAVRGEMLINAADKGWPRMMANIAFLKALHGNVMREFKADRKGMHKGKRKAQEEQTIERDNSL